MVDVSFIYLPGASLNTPANSFTVLKSYLENNDIKSKIHYINHVLENDFITVSTNSNKSNLLLMLFLRILNINSKEKKSNIDFYIFKRYPELFSKDDKHIKQKIDNLESLLLSLVDVIVNKLLTEKPTLIGFSVKYNQWIPSIIFANRIKEISPETKIIFGGWSNKTSAKNLLKLNYSIDYCIWGEGEIPLLKLALFLCRKDCSIMIENIPRLLLKNATIPYNSDELEKSYVSFDTKQPLLDFTDFLKITQSVDYSLPIERIRSCSWNKCKFCFLAQGYKYRVKKTNILIDEIDNLVKKYKITKFNFTDNDVVGKDLDEFNRFLDLLIEYKKNVPKFEITMAQVITKNINADIVKKMSDAGFNNIQIGLESISGILLSKMNKNQTISENFFFIKNAIINGINIIAPNIIINTPDESDLLINDSISNLHCYRFILSNKDFNFELVPLNISNYSKYLQEIRLNNKLDSWSITEIPQELLPDKYFKDIDRFSLFSYSINKKENPLWKLFRSTQIFYKKQMYNYKIVKNNENKTFKYIEYTGNNIVNEIEFNESIYWCIFSLLETRVYNIDELISTLCENDDCLTSDDCLTKINILNSYQLVFISKIDKTIFSIINL